MSGRHESLYIQQIDKTLAAQLQINEQEIAQHEALLNFGDKDVSFSVGIVWTRPEEIVDIDNMITAADNHMYKAKAKASAGKKPGLYISLYQPE